MKLLADPSYGRAIRLLRLTLLVANALGVLVAGVGWLILNAR